MGTSDPVDGHNEISSHSWDDHRDLIEQLYLVEDRSLSEVQHILRENYGFVASSNQFKRRINAWGLAKNVTRTDMERIAQTLQRTNGAELATRTADKEIIVEGKRVRLSQVKRYISRNRRRRHLVQDQYAPQTSSISLQGDGTSEPTTDMSMSQGNYTGTSQELARAGQSAASASRQIGLNEYAMSGDNLLRVLRLYRKAFDEENAVLPAAERNRRFEQHWQDVSSRLIEPVPDQRLFQHGSGDPNNQASHIIPTFVGSDDTQVESSSTIHNSAAQSLTRSVSQPIRSFRVGVDSSDPVARSGTPTRSELSGPSPKGQVLLACPFYKHDAERFSRKNTSEPAFRICDIALLKSISRLKQHLYRIHAPQEHTCKRCLRAFASKDLLDVHSQEAECETATLPQHNGIMTIEQDAAIRKKRRVGQTEKDGWYEIYSTLFPGETLPKSPYVEGDHARAPDDSGTREHFVHLFRAIGPELTEKMLKEVGVQQSAMPSQTWNVVAYAFDEAFPEHTVDPDLQSSFRDLHVHALALEGIDVFREDSAAPWNPVMISDRPDSPPDWRIPYVAVMHPSSNAHPFAHPDDLGYTYWPDLDVEEI